MNRETKIGMLTGLGVIVLIGVLLSQYFEQTNPGNRPASMYDVSAHYRQATRSPVGVPTLDADTALASAQGISLRLPDQGSALPAFAAQQTPANNSAASPPSAQAANQLPQVIPVPANQPSMPPMIDPNTNNNQGVQPALYSANNPSPAPGLPTGPAPLSLDKPNSPLPAPSASDPAAKPAGTTYMIAKGDTLTLIAKKFYHSAGKADRQRIMTANNMKDEKSLITGKKLLIPTTPNQPLASTSTNSPAPAKPVGVRTSSIVKLPGAPASTAGSAQPTHIEAPKSSATTYTVKSNDTIEKIATKFLGSHSKQAQQQILTLNHLKSADLQIGQILKIPAKAASSKPTQPAPKG